MPSNRLGLDQQVANQWALRNGNDPRFPVSSVGLTGQQNFENNINAEYGITKGYIEKYNSDYQKREWTHDSKGKVYSTKNLPKAQAGSYTSQLEFELPKQKTINLQNKIQRKSFQHIKTVNQEDQINKIINKIRQNAGY